MMGMGIYAHYHSLPASHRPPEDRGVIVLLPTSSSLVIDNRWQCHRKDS